MELKINVQDNHAKIRMQSLIEALTIPQNLDQAEDEWTEDAITYLNLWKDSAFQALREISKTIDASGSEELQSSLIYAVAPFQSKEVWSSGSHTEVSSGANNPWLAPSLVCIPFADRNPTWIRRH